MVHGSKTPNRIALERTHRDRQTTGPANSFQRLAKQLGNPSHATLQMGSASPRHPMVPGDTAETEKPWRNAPGDPGRSPDVARPTCTAEVASRWLTAAKSGTPIYQIDVSWRWQPDFSWARLADRARHSSNQPTAKPPRSSGAKHERLEHRKTHWRASLPHATGGGARQGQFIGRPEPAMTATGQNSAVRPWDRPNYITFGVPRRTHLGIPRRKRSPFTTPTGGQTKNPVELKTQTKPFEAAF